MVYMLMLHGTRLPTTHIPCLHVNHSYFTITLSYLESLAEQARGEFAEQPLERREFAKQPRNKTKRIHGIEYIMKLCLIMHVNSMICQENSPTTAKIKYQWGHIICRHLKDYEHLYLLLYI